MKLIKKLCLLFVLCGLFMFCSKIKAKALEESLFLSTGKYWYENIIQTNDENYIVVGAKWVNVSDSNNTSNIIIPFAKKINQLGETIWEKEFSNYLFGSIKQVAEDTNGNITLIGLFSFEPARPMIITLDKDGNKLWEEEIQTFASLQYNEVIPYEDNFILVGSDALSNDDYGTKAFVKVYDSSNNTIHSQMFESNIFTVVKGVEVLSDKSYILVGTCNDGDNTNYSDSCIAKFDSEHNMLWHDMYPDSGIDYFNDIAINSNNEIVVVGTSKNSTTYNGKGIPLIVKYNQDGTLLDSQMLDNYSENSELNKIIITEQNQCAMVGNDGNTGFFIIYEDNIIIEEFTPPLFSENNVFVSLIQINDGFIVTEKTLTSISNFQLPDIFFETNYVGSLVKYTYTEKDSSNEIKNKKIFGESYKLNPRYYDSLDIADLLSKAKTSFHDGYILSENDGTSSTLEIYDANGILKKSTDIPDNIVIDIATIDNNIYVLSTDAIKSYITKYNHNLEKQKTIEVKTNLEASMGMIYFANIKTFKSYNGKLYIINSNGDGADEYDADLNLIRSLDVINDLEEILIISPDYTNLNLLSTSSSPIFYISYDKLNNKEVYAGMLESSNTGILRIYENGKIKRNITNLGYIYIGSAKFVGEYIVAIGAGSGENGLKIEMIVLDQDGNIVQVFNDKAGYFSVTPNKQDNSFMVYTYTEQTENCPADTQSETCYKLETTKYSLALDINKQETKNGTIEILNQAMPGEEVIFTVSPKEGYVFEGLRIIDENGNETIVTGSSFIMPNTKITIEPIFTVKNPNTITFLKIGFITVIIFAIYNLFISKKLKLKRYA